MELRKPIAFVLMPFDQSFDWLWEDALLPCLVECGYETVRADSVLDQQNLLIDIIRGISNSHLIIADITNLNPNVMYELGISHALRKSVVMLSQEISTVPFDLRSYRIITYTPNFKDVKVLIEKLTKIAEGHIQNEVSFGNPVTDFLPNEIVDPPKATPIPIEAQPIVVDTLELPKGLIEYEEEFMDVSSSITSWLENLGLTTNDLAQNIQRRTDQLNSLPSATDKEALRRRSVTAESVSTLLTTWSKEIHETLPKATQLWEKFENAAEEIISNASLTTEEDATAARELVKIVEGFTTNIEDLTLIVKQSKDELSPMAKVSRSLSKSVPNSMLALDSLADTLSIGKSLGYRLISILEDRLEEFPVA